LQLTRERMNFYDETLSEFLQYFGSSIVSGVENGMNRVFDVHQWNVFSVYLKELLYADTWFLLLMFLHGYPE
ncbi:hypothetical protein ACJX0J_009205, partial [Zea mays]